MMIFKRLFLPILVGFMLTGCGTSYYYAEFIYPSRQYIPSDLYKIGFVNHAASPGTTATIYSGNEVVDYAPGLPLKVAEEVGKALEKENEAMGRYNITSIPWDHNMGSGDIKPGKELTLAQADSICVWQLVDGLIIAEGSELTARVSGTREIVDVWDDAGNAMRVAEFTARTKLNLTMRWRFYDYVRKVFIDEYENSYEFTVDHITYTEKEAMAFNPRDVEVGELAANVAVDYYSRVAPFWMEDFRKYYQTGNSEMYRIANDLEYDGDWEKASRGWTELSEDADQKIAHRALFNLAVASEMLGDPNEAKEWLQKAEALKETKETKKYMERLEKQILLYQVVSRQLGLADE